MKARGFRFSFTPLAGVLFTFPSRYYALSVAVRIQPWIVVDPDSGRVPRAPPYSGTASRRLDSFAYGAVTLCSRAVRRVRLVSSFLSTPRDIPARPFYPACAVWAPPRSLAATWGISVDFFSRVTEMVHFTQCGFRALFYSSVRMAESLPPGCPIREPTDRRTLAPPRGLSRPAAPFFAGRPQGIRLGPALAWPYCPFRAPP